MKKVCYCVFVRILRTCGFSFPSPLERHRAEFDSCLFVGTFVRELAIIGQLNKEMICIISSCALVFTISCSDSGKPLGPIKGELFAVYFLRDTSTTMEQILSRKINELELAGNPWLTSDDIDFYDWSSHCVYLKKGKGSFFPAYQFFYHFPNSWTDRPYVVVLNNRRCYVGYFLTQSSIHQYAFPFIDILDVGMYPEDIIHSQWVFLFGEDARNNADVKMSLMENRLFHAGLDVQIDSLWISNADTATVQYKISIVNHDVDNLYVLDPDKTGGGLFHCYNNGPVFKSRTTVVMYEARYKEAHCPDSSTYWTPNWFTLVESGKSIHRTIRLKGYPYIPKGDYLCEMTYGGPVFIKKEQRTSAEGRYWLGDARTKVIGATTQERPGEIVEMRIIAK
jgi:hypothetical protein